MKDRILAFATSLLTAGEVPATGKAKLSYWAYLAMEPDASKNFIDIIKTSLPRVPASGYLDKDKQWGKVLVYPLYQACKSKLLPISLDGFKKILGENYRQLLSRADIPPHDQLEIIKDSEIKYLNAQFHVLNVDRLNAIKATIEVQAADVPAPIDFGHGAQKPTETPSKPDHHDEKWHKFMHLAKPPYRYVGVEQKIYRAHQGAPAQPGGSCDYCGQAIVYVFTFKGSDDKTFKLGSDCAVKTDDSYIITKVKRAKLDLDTKLRHEADAKKKGSVTEMLADPDTRTLLSEMAHPKGFKGKTMLDYATWMSEHAGAAGTGRLLKELQKALATAKAVP